MMASVSGIFILTVVPRPGRLSMSTVPPIFSMLVRTTSMPTPRPEKCVTWSAVEKPGRKMRLTSSRSLSRSACSGVISLAWMALSRTRCGSMPSPSSVISMMTLPPSWKACSEQPALGGLAPGQPLVGGLDAVIDGIAHQVRQRVADGLDDRLVQLGLLPLQVDARLLAAGDRQVADHAGELVPDVADRLHPRLHDAGLQLGRQQVQPLHGAEEGGVLLGGAELHDLVARQDQLADEGHQLVEQADVDADGAVGDGRSAAARPAPRRGVRAGTGGSATLRGARGGAVRGRRLADSRAAASIGDRRERPRARGRALRTALGGAGPPNPPPAGGRCEAEVPELGGTPTRVERGQAPRVLQALQGLDQRGIIAITLALRLLDGREHAPDGVHHAQQGAWRCPR